jgi:hypothetical protein
MYTATTKLQGAEIADRSRTHDLRMEELMRGPFSFFLSSKPGPATGLTVVNALFFNR